MSRYAAGRRKEWMCQRFLAKHAQMTTRAAGSKGLADIIAVYQEVVQLVQVKYVKPGAPWKDANWRKLISLVVPKNVHRVAYVYRRGRKTPERHYVYWNGEGETCT